MFQFKSITFAIVGVSTSEMKPQHLVSERQYHTKIYFCPSTNWPLEALAPGPARNDRPQSDHCIQSITFISVSPGDLSTNHPMTDHQEEAPS
ncbi:hypothetical protein ACN38_g4577 [Penicillium nordicum]|uniref:Uncharacterized protein n=1 Tax=Penicillium nordicum TaxID=229535 RepID=A0A0M8PBU6_9EURO|nr:hypothetical protein ACN38_g4577 [Penicillium nordicum]